ncbi:Phosphatidylinositol N-acetylglucosaminyltransferase subunit GPI19 [Meyerozyma sp. JA9]|nr:Phosphatidylinositol N-acetylglucosaminyltransferase subunit GPI19 [Meyerozyma sp. JA9]
MNRLFPEHSSSVSEPTHNISNAEYRGFFIYVLSSISLFVWIGWTVIPENILENYLYIEYYPDKYWTVAIPAYSLMLMVYIYIGMALYNTEVLTFAIDDVRNFVDSYTYMPEQTVPGSRSKYEKTIDYVWKAPSGVWDLPITLVNEVLYTDDNDE